ncbi:4-hydroxyphenylacetate 3-hydroxylase N-terminal domain-containing protein [Planosporangium mesophilum]|uniref:Pyoverdin chromophore biosynthetic protein pvcC n=1 Tax=Planosporangium mesophilum TaxID=689768 RepID=A0A8J3TB59_9ACTN|nr:4-hydroxyphenylacetate 3-hydroxylase N-terminal domain-containing protein [Planosporangium mesophilum]NJC86283.1 Pyoverdin chromophore biosynthetic protein pvcC [Planosporangium mesophilum]GII23308.1 pyoverdin chromophore biosynthetic protein pvcC [Planosporangium mesophilum]
MSTDTAPAQTGTGAATRPLTGEEYLESIRDGREVWIYGERVEDVTTHPAFRNSARMIARMYDALHDPERNQKIVVPTDSGNGYTHAFFKAPYSSADLRASADAIAEFSRLTYGWLGRSPDYKASFLSTLGSNTDFYAPYDANARRWYREAQEKCLYFNHAIVNPPIDRNRAADDVRDVNVHVVRETDEGIIVSGAKVVATGSAFTHYNFIGSYAPVRSKDFSAIFIVPMNAKGVKLFCRPSYEFMAATVGSPFDYPLTSRLDENDAIFVFDEVLVPWENVFCYEPEKANNFFVGSGFIFRAMMHGCVRLAVKFDFLCGLLLKGLDMTGTAEFRGVQSRVGELLNYRNLFWTCVDSMVNNPTPWNDGTMLPNADACMTYRMMSTIAYPRAKEIFEQDLGSALIYQNSNAIDWQTPEMRPYLEKYVRGSNGHSGVERIKLMKLIWDAIGTEFGGRHELYERNYSGNHEAVRLETLWGQMSSGQTDRYREFVDRCLAEYDLDGWTVPDLINSDDVNVVRRRLTQR